MGLLDDDDLLAPHSFEYSQYTVAGGVIAVRQVLWKTPHLSGMSVSSPEVALDKSLGILLVKVLLDSGIYYDVIESRILPFLQDQS